MNENDFGRTNVAIDMMDELVYRKSKLCSYRDDGCALETMIHVIQIDKYYSDRSWERTKEILRLTLQDYQKA